MSKFYVGQRVKSVKPRRPGLTEVGMQGNISSIGPFHEGEISWDGCLFPTKADITVMWDNGVDTATDFFRVIPVLPEGHQPAEMTVHELLPFLKTTADA